METRIQLRRDTTANWETNNPVLAIGEIGYDLTAGSFKVGDGSSQWNSLPYFFQFADAMEAAAGTSTTTVLSPATAKFIEIDGSEFEEE